MAPEETLLKQVMELALKMGQNQVNPEDIQELRLLVQQLKTKQSRIEKDLYPEGGQMTFVVMREFVTDLKRNSYKNRGIIIGALIAGLINIIIFALKLLNEVTP